jgi:hypothetical protein
LSKNWNLLVPLGISYVEIEEADGAVARRVCVLVAARTRGTDKP